MLPERSYDLGLFANIAHTAPAVKNCRLVVNVSHGIIPDERPHNDLEAWFTSEEVKGFWKRDGAIVRQPIDCEYWRPSDEKRDLLLFYSYRSKNAFGLDALAERLGLTFAYVRDVTHEDARDMMRRAALCCASGRAALEAMACGAPTLICDWRPYNGAPLIEFDLEIAMRANYSGRGGVDARASHLDGLARAAMERGGLRDYVLRHHDHRKIADQILRLSEC